MANDTLYPGISYLTIQNNSLNQTLYLADLDTEENKRPNKGLPVYIPPGATVTLPMTARVLDSYYQGAIRGFITAGMVTGQVIERPDDSSAGFIEVWVSPDGDDANPGTKAAPFRTAWHAVEVLKQYGSVVCKTINFTVGATSRYIEGGFCLNTPRWVLRGIGIGEDRPVLFVNPAGANPGFFPKTDRNIGVVAAITNMTDTSYAEFLSEGGVGFQISAGSFSYTGASLRREDTPPPHEYDLFYSDVEFDNLELISYSNDTNDNAGSVWVLGAPYGDSDVVEMSRVSFNNCYMYASSKSGSQVRQSITLYTKNSLFAVNKCLVGAASPWYSVVLDNCYEIDWAGFQRRGREDIGVIVNIDDVVSNGAPYPGKFRQRIFGNTGLDPSVAFRYIDFYGNIADPYQEVIHVFNLATKSLSLNGNFAVQENINTPVANVHAASAITHKSTGSLLVTTLTCGSLSKTGSGVMNIARLLCRGNVAVSSGTSNTVGSGTIVGNLTVSGGANIDLSGVIVKGNVNLTGAGTVKWKGGHFEGTLTDPGNKLGGATAGSYLYVG